jgi:hypothetical protein
MVKRVAFLLAVIALCSASIIIGASSASAGSAATCTNGAPGVLSFGLRNNPSSQAITVTSGGYWEAYAGASWIKINNQSTYISSGNATPAVTLSEPIPAGQPYLCGGTITTSVVSLVDFNSSCPVVQVQVNYITCPCC